MSCLPFGYVQGAVPSYLALVGVFASKVLMRLLVITPTAALKSGDVICIRTLRLRSGHGSENSLALVGVITNKVLLGCWR